MGSNQTEKFETTRKAEEQYLQRTLKVVDRNIENYSREGARMQAEIDEMLERYHDNDAEVYTALSNTVTLHDHMKRALLLNKKAQNKPYFGRIIFQDEALNKKESIYIGKGGIHKDATHFMVVDWRAPVAGAYYESNLGKCSYMAPGDVEMKIDLELKRTYEIEEGRLLDYFDSEVIANDDLLTRYLAKNKQAVLNEIVATIQKEQNEIIRKSPYHNMIVQGVAGSGKTTVAMHRISFILYNYAQRFKPDDFYIVGSNRILLEYITGVLPDLDVYGVRQMTMEQLFVRLLYEDWDDEKYGIISTKNCGDKESIKGSRKWFEDLESYCRELEEKSIPVQTVYLNPRQFVEGIKDGRAGVFDETGGGEPAKEELVCLLEKEAIESYVRENPAVSIQNKINMLNERLRGKIKDEFLTRGLRYTEAERKAIFKAYRGTYGGRKWKRSIFEMYQDFLIRQRAKGYLVDIPKENFHVYDLAALAYLYKRVTETEVISEAHHVVIDEAQDFGMMAYMVLKFCIRECTYTIMGDVSQNIHFNYGLNDWEELKELFVPASNDPKSCLHEPGDYRKGADSFHILRKSYRNTVEISDFATNILRHGKFSVYPAQPIIRHGSPVLVKQVSEEGTLIKKAAEICRGWQEKGLDTIGVVCRNQEKALKAAGQMAEYVQIMETDPEKAVFGNGIMVLPVEYTKGLEFDAVLILNPTDEEYPEDDGHAKLLYVAATRALHELCILHLGNPSKLFSQIPILEKGEKLFQEESKGSKEERNENCTGKNNIKKGSTGKNTKPVAAGSAAIKVKKPVARLVATGNRMTLATPEEKKPFLARKMQVAQVEKSGGKSPAGGNCFSESRNLGVKDTSVSGSGYEFGDMPVNEKLRPAGHGKIDLGVLWVMKQKDGLYLQSRYGVLRISPVESSIIRITFARGGQILEKTHPEISIHRVEAGWMYKESGSEVTLMTDELCLQVDKKGGAIRFLTRDKKLLLEEQKKEGRQFEKTASGVSQARQFLTFQKGEKIFGLNGPKEKVLDLRGSARYLSGGGRGTQLSLVFSDKGYGIVPAAGAPVIFYDITAYGTGLLLENTEQIDYYFITGKQKDEIRDAYLRLCGKFPSR